MSKKSMFINLHDVLNDKDTSCNNSYCNIAPISLEEESDDRIKHKYNSCDAKSTT